MAKSFIDMAEEFIMPTATYLYNIVLPILKSFFLYLSTFDWYGILTSKTFLIFVRLLILLIGVLLYLRVFYPKIYSRLIDALKFEKEETDETKKKFLFKTGLDISVLSE